MLLQHGSGSSLATLPAMRTFNMMIHAKNVIKTKMMLITASFLKSSNAMFPKMIAYVRKYAE